MKHMLTAIMISSRRQTKQQDKTQNVQTLALLRLSPL